MINEEAEIEEIGKNISLIKRISNEIDLLLRGLKRVESPSEKRIIISQIGILRARLKEVSDEIIESAEKILLIRPLKELTKSDITFNIPKLPSLPATIPPKKPGVLKIKSEKIRPNTLEKISLKKIMKKKAKKFKKRERKPSKYINLANKFFYNISNSLVNKGKFRQLGRTLVKSNLEYIPATYASVIFFSTLISFIIAVFLVALLLFFNVSTAPPFIIKVEEELGARLLKVFWIIFVLPLIAYSFAYYYPSLEKKSLESKINQELPFATIHMASITSSMIEPSKIFNILISTGGYPHLGKEFTKLQNEINIYGYDIVTALRHRATNSPSRKLSDLYNGLITTITSGGDLPQFFEKRSQTLLFEHRLDVEKSAKTAETFMDIYISVVIAAPMILMLLLMMMSISGFGISLSPFMISMIMILSVSIINIMFLAFLHLKQPKD